MFNPYFSDWPELEYDVGFCLALAEPMIAFFDAARGNETFFYHGHQSDFENATEALWRLGLIFGRDRYSDACQPLKDNEDIAWNDESAASIILFRIPFGNELKELYERVQTTPVSTAEMLSAYCNIFEGGYSASNFQLGGLDDLVTVPHSHRKAFAALLKKGYVVDAASPHTYAWTDKIRKLADLSNSY